MSSVVKTITPFLDKELLLQALDAVGCKYTLRGNEILTDRVDYRGNQKFVWNNSRYSFWHDSHENMWHNINTKEYKTVSGFLASVEKAYNTIYQKKLEEFERLRLEALAEAERKRLEEERLRLERERQEYVEKQRSTIIAKAKEKGYSVREEKVKDKIKLVLVRNTY
jgi:hypothetical protein